MPHLLIRYACFHTSVHAIAITRVPAPYICKRLDWPTVVSEKDQGGIAETTWLQGYTNLAGPTSSDERTRPLRCIQVVLDIAWLHNVQ